MKMMDFFDLLQVSVGNKKQLAHVLTDQEWLQMMDVANRQALLGILFEGINLLPQEQWPRRELVFKWAMAAENVKHRNMQTTNVCLRLVAELKKFGFDVCILKGQGNHVYYEGLTPEHNLGMLRICGDIDAWIWPKQKTKHPVKSIIEFCQEKHILVSLCHLHAEVKPINGVPIEIHFRPSFLNAPWRDKVFQRIFKQAKFVEADIDGCGSIQKLRVDYDLIFQLNHIYRHLLDEGVGLRQVLDFYALLKTYLKEVKENPDMMDVPTLMKHISHCGMCRFVSALVYVLKVIFGMGEEELLCPPSEKHGKFLLNEIMLAGNFGHYDERMVQLEVKKGKLSYQLKKAQRRFTRNLRFLTSYPEEVICEPMARVVHWLWRKYGLWRW